MNARALLKTGILILILSVFILQSCNKDDHEIVEKDKYLVSYNVVRTLNKSPEIDVIFNYLKLLYPSLTDIQKIAAESKTGVRVYYLVYNTTFKGEQKQASGLVCVPVGTGPYPILGFQNGTNVEHRNAPSKNINNELFTFAEAVASTGFILAIPDYLGFGASEDMFHPYLHAESTKQCVVDMLRAVKEMCTKRYIGEILSENLYLMGYSLGGWATMQVHKAVETEYPSEFNLIASACGAGPYDLNLMNDIILKSTIYPQPYYLGFLFDSYKKLNEFSNPVSDIFKEPYATRLPSLFDGIKSSDEINAQLTSTVADLITSDYKANYASGSKYVSIRNALSTNSIQPWKTLRPIYIVHGQSDKDVPYQTSQQIYNGFVSAGITPSMVTLILLQGLDHQAAIVPAMTSSLAWLIEQRKKYP